MNRKQKIKKNIIYISLIVLGLLCFIWSYSRSLVDRMTPDHSFVDGCYYNYWIENGVLFSTYIVDGYVGEGKQSYQYNYVDGTGKKELKIKTDANVILNIKVYSNNRVLFEGNMYCKAGVDVYQEMEFIEGEELFIDISCDIKDFNFTIGVD